MHSLFSVSSKNSVVLFFLLFSFYSCVPARKALFFDGLVPSKDSVDQAAEEFAKKIYPGDRISINIIVADADQALLNSGLNAASGGANLNQQAGGGVGYLVDKDGNVQLVKFGLLHVSGLTPAQVAEEVKSRVAVQYRDPTVYCTLSGRVLFLGSGSAGGGGGGAVPINNDRLTILEALALKGTGDPTAIRERVWVIREKGETREYATIDINSKDVFRSPYFYLRNNDIIYLEPNRLNTFLAVNGPLFRLIGTVTSTLFLFVSVLALIK